RDRCITGGAARDAHDHVTVGSSPARPFRCVHPRSASAHPHRPDFVFHAHRYKRTDRPACPSVPFRCVPGLPRRIAALVVPAALTLPPSCTLHCALCIPPYPSPCPTPHSWKPSPRPPQPPSSLSTSTTSSRAAARRPAIPTSARSS